MEVNEKIIQSLQSLLGSTGTTSLSTIVTQNKNIYIKDVIVRNCVSNGLYINGQPEPTFFIFNSQFLITGGSYGIYTSGRYYDIRYLEDAIYIRNVIKK
jgi:hypothetical protein